ncbi:MAG: transposase [Kiritimatiellae bacterium]|nr:transposase [Kiritimatiellia bacterium]
MELWIQWWSLVVELRSAFMRKRTFLWFALALAAISIRTDLRGVTSLVRAAGLREHCYDRLLDFFHSPSIDLNRLTVAWTALVLRVLRPFIFTVNGRLVLLADGIKAPKSGRKMPAVKKLHQESESNTKPEFIFGHSCQAIAVVVRAASSFFALPLACRIHEGVVSTNRDQRSLLDKLVELLLALCIRHPYYLVADTYYASASIIKPLLKVGHHLITAVRSNAVAYELPDVPGRSRSGRPCTYGKKVHLRTLFDDLAAFVEAPSPVYGESNVILRYRVVELLWRPVGHVVRFVLVIHPTRGRKIMLCTDPVLDSLQIIQLYGVRFKIEVTFKQTIHTVGTYCYHFWMSDMSPRPRRSGNQYLHRKSALYREHVYRKLGAYHAHIQLGLIAHGLLQALSILCSPAVWKHFGSWLRTIRPELLPSELVVTVALRHTLPAFLADSSETHILAIFIRERLDLQRYEGAILAA